MIVRIVILWIALVGIVGGSAYMIFPWYNLTAIALLAVASGIVSAIAVGIVRLRSNAGGGDSTARASNYQSKGARGRDE